MSNFDFDIYGSFAMDLSIESSDIDISIAYPINSNLDNITSKIIFEFTALKVFDVITPLLSASVPVIKFVRDFILFLILFKLNRLSTLSKSL